jgi:FolB domain-containing protein
MASSRVIINGIRARGRHGANLGEQDAPQDFAIDLQVTVEVAEDSLHGTLDYRVLTDLARDTVEDTSFVLLETLADAIAKVLLETGLVRDVLVTVHKPAAAAELGAADVSATVRLVD